MLCRGLPISPYKSLGMACTDQPLKNMFPNITLFYGLPIHFPLLQVPLVGSSSNYHIASMPATRGPYLNVNTQLANANYGAVSSPLMSPSYLSHGPPTTPMYAPSFAQGTPLSPWGGLPLPLPGYGAGVATSLAAQPPPPPPSTPVQGLSQLPPNHPYLQDYAMLVLNNITRLQAAEAEGHHQETERQDRGVAAHSQASGVTQPSPSPSTQTMGVSGHGSSGMGSSLHSSPLRYTTLVTAPLPL